MIDPATLASLAFVEELDRLKGIERQTVLYDRSRRENTAEHSWHLATSIIVLAHLADEPINLERAIKMALVHDVVEIDAGDTFVYDTTGYLDKELRENKAANRLFGMIAGHTGEELHALWLDFEIQNCPESRFVSAVDRLLPTLANFKTGGHTWVKHGIVKSQVIEKVKTITAGSKKLGDFATHIVEESVRIGILSEG